MTDCADGSPHGEDFLIQFLGQPPHPLHVVGVGQIEKRLDVELPLAGVAKQRRGHLVALQHVLHPHQEIGQHLGRNSHVFDDRHGTARALHPVQRRLHLVDQAARTTPLRRSSNACRAPNAIRFCCHSSLTRRCSRLRTSNGSSPSCSTSSTASVSGGNQLRPTAARPRARGSGAGGPSGRTPSGCSARIVQHGAGGLLQAVEQQQRHAAVPRQRLGAQRGLGDQGQRPLGADQQPRHVEISVAEHVGQVVSAVVQRTLGLVLPDQFGLLAQATRPAGRPVPVSAEWSWCSAPSTSGSRPNSSTWPSANTTCRLCTWRRVEPYFSQRLPAASMANMLPRVVTLLVAGSGPKSRPCRLQLLVEPPVDHARLHADPVLVDADHPPQMGGEIDDQARPQRFARHAGARAAGVDRQCASRPRTARKPPRRPPIAGEPPPSGLIS